MAWASWFRGKLQLALLLLLAAFVVAKGQTFGGAGAAIVPFTLQAATAGGATPYHYIATGAANQDSTCPATGAHQIYGWNPSTVGTVPAELKFYDSASSPTSSGTPIKTITIPGNSAGAGNNKDSIIGITVTNGLCFRVTTGLADNDAGAVATGTVSIDFDYK